MSQEIEYTEAEPTAESGLDAFAAALAAAEESQPVSLPEEVEEEVEADDEPEVPEAEPSDEPSASAEMLAVARLAGVPEELLTVAKDNTSVERLIDFFSKQQQPEESKEEAPSEPETDELAVQDLLGEDEYDPTDPVHKQIKHMVGVINKQRAEERKTLQLLLAHAQHQLQEKQQVEAASFQQPYDEALDELDNPAFGNSSKGLTDSQIKMRAAAFKGYISLVDGEPAERRRDLAKAAIKAKYANLFPERVADKAVEQRVKQAKKKLGGSTGKSVAEALSPEERFARALAELSAGAS